MRDSRFVRCGLACCLLVAATGCGSAEDSEPKASPVTLRGRIESIDESRLSWDKLTLGLACEGTLKESGNVVYSAGEEYRKVPIGPDHTFEIELPGEIEPGWYGQVLSQASCAFDFRVYNDQNANGALDVKDIADPGGYEDPQELVCDNGSGQPICGVQFIRDPAFYETNLGMKMTAGWNYMHGLKDWSSDFDREFVLTSLTAKTGSGQ